MDQNATLAELREFLKLNTMGRLDDEQTDRALELMAALDGWLTTGGFPPVAWRQSFITRG